MGHSRSTLRSPYQLLVPIEVRRQGEEITDVYGNPVPGAWESDVIHVFAVVEGGEDMATAAQPERARYDLTVYAASSEKITTSDRLVWGGELFEVARPPWNWDANPWWQPGLQQVNANRIDGAGYED